MTTRWMIIFTNVGEDASGAPTKPNRTYGYYCARVYSVFLIHIATRTTTNYHGELVLTTLKIDRTIIYHYGN